MSQAHSQQLAQTGAGLSSAAVLGRRQVVWPWTGLVEVHRPPQARGRAAHLRRHLWPRPRPGRVAHQRLLPGPGLETLQRSRQARVSGFLGLYLGFWGLYLGFWGLYLGFLGLYLGFLGLYLGFWGLYLGFLGYI